MPNENAQQTSGAAQQEILEVVLGKQSFGVSVLKVQAIEQYDPARVTSLPLAPPQVLGMLLFRERTIPLVDLSVELGVESSACGEQLGEATQTGQENQVVLVTEFNRTTVAFLADGVNRIHRISMDQISPIDSMLNQTDSAFTGSVNIEKREILIIDMEKIVSQLCPEAGSDFHNAEEIAHPRSAERSEVKIILAEDSHTVQSLITDVLRQGNYTSVTACDNGQLALSRLEAIKQQADQAGRPVTDFINVLITDIEMPQLDGVSLCRAVKQTLGLGIPVVLFSTLHSDELQSMCKACGADAYITKPQVVQLVKMLDSLTLEAQPA